MTVTPSTHPPLDVELFEYANEWIYHDGKGQPVPDDKYVKVMYSNGFVANRIRAAKAWTQWTGGRDWWIKPDDDRLYILMYVVV